MAAVAGLSAQAIYFSVRQYKELTSGRAAQRQALKKALLAATDYATWSDAATKLEAASGRDPRRQAELAGRLYDRQLLQQRLHHLKTVRERGGEPIEMMFALRSDLLRNLGNMASTALHETILQVPTFPIREYIDEVRTQLKAIASSPAAPLDDRLAFLRETRHAFGRTALVLSGGGSFGSFHLGVVEVLIHSGLLPRVLSGSSAGAIVAALICTRTPDELTELFAELPERLQGIDFYASNSTSQLLRHLVLKGTLQDHRVLQERLQRLLGDVTFQEAYARSGRILNVSVSAADTTEPPKLLNYLTTPSVIVWSAVACSSAFPFLFAPQTLLARDARGRIVPFANQTAGEAQRRWRDGSLEEDLPMRGLSEMFNVNYFLVSQCNPYLLPIIAAKRAVPRTLGNLMEQEFKHRCKQLMEILPRTLGASRLLKLLSQPWEGDITMVLPASSISSLKAVVNLSRGDLLRSLAEGQRAAWSKLSAIAGNCDIEVTLDEVLRQVTTAARRERAKMRRHASSAANLSGMRAGIPSWLHLQALGLAHSESHETLEAVTPKAHDVLMTGSGGVFGRGGGGGSRMHRSAASRSQVDLTDTIMPEDVELSAAVLNALGVAAEVLGEVDESDLGNGGGDDDDDLPASHYDSRFEASNMSLGCGDDVWKDLFTTVMPVTAASDALDFIAP